MVEMMAAMKAVQTVGLTAVQLAVRKVEMRVAMRAG